MSDPVIESPLPGAEAFEQDEEIAAWSQAAQIVGLGLQLAGHADVLWEEGGASDLQIPAVPPLKNPFPAEFAELYLQDHGSQLPFHWRDFPGWSQPIASHIQDMVKPAPQQWWQQLGLLHSWVTPDLAR
ncbi:hypothetical protein U9R90_00515 [Streptomyces sp. E11-3]|uniref:hypothetical protein n=1 Tax=Streptomyces sp. E11-3 TaxID=3110112 RepID=UPI003980CDDB